MLPGERKKKKQNSNFPSGLIEVTAGPVVQRWPPHLGLTQWHISCPICLRDQEERSVPPKDLGDSECVCVCLRVRMHLYVDLMFTQWVPACLWIIHSCSHTHTHTVTHTCRPICTEGVPSSLLLICTGCTLLPFFLFCIMISFLLSLSSTFPGLLRLHFYVSARLILSVWACLPSYSFPSRSHA